MDNLNPRSNRLPAFAAILLATLLTAAARAQSNRDLDLLRSVIAQCDAALDRTDPMYVEFTWRKTSGAAPDSTADKDAPDNAMISEGHTRLWRRGDSYHQDLDLKHVWPGRGRTSDVSCIVVANDRYLAMFWKRPKFLHIYRYDSRKDLYIPVETFLPKFPNPDILQFGFSVGSLRVSEAYEIQNKYDPPMYNWTITTQEAGASTQYLIRSDRIRGKRTGPWYEFVVDASRGYLVTEFRGFSQSHETTTELQQLPGGQWFPKSGRISRFANTENAEFTVNVVRLGEEIPESRFTIEAMTFEKDETQLTDFSPGGRERTEKAYWAGEWAPLDKLPSDARIEFEKAREELMRGATDSFGHEPLALSPFP